jgi:hypothetical protein
MTYADNYNIRTTSVKFNDVADAIDGSITRPFGGTTTGTTTAYIASPSPAWTAYDTASFITIIPHVTNAAGPVTLNVSGLGTKTIKRGGSDLVAGVLVQNIPTILIYTGVYFDVIAAANALLLDGSGTMLGNINFGGFRPHNVAGGSAANASYYGSTDATTGIFFPGSSTFCITTGGAERFRINSSGLIGIGTTSPGFTLDVQSTTANLVATRFSADTSPSQLILRKSRGGSVGTNTLVLANDSLGGVYFQAANGTSYTDAAGILAEVDGTPGASNDMPTRLRFFTTADGSGTLTERMRIDSTGRIGIGATAPGEQLHVQTTGDDNTLRLETSGNRPSIRFTRAGTGRAQIFTDGGGFTSGSADALCCRAGGSGGVYLAATGTSWAAISDIRFKKNIKNLEYGLPEVLNMRPVRFDYIDDDSDLSARIGLIAQELKPIIPEAVQGDEAIRLGIASTETIPVLIKAIQELAARVALLEGSI